MWGRKVSELMPEPTRGIHHITAIAGDPQRNLDFYTGVLGLRLVKLTVNFDDPGTYHFYFGDTSGQPGTLLTFFPWTEIRRGRRGTGQVGMAAFRIPLSATGYWADRLKKAGMTTGQPFRRFDEEVLQLLDPDGLALELIASPRIPAEAEAWAGGPVPAAQAIRGLAGPTLLLEGFERTAEVLTGVLGMTFVEQDDARYRFAAGEVGAGGSTAAGATIDLEVRPSDVYGSMGSGAIHHIAFRARDEAHQLEYRGQLAALGLDVTPVLDRQYFKSIYFREPGGILFEIATDTPGFATDETPDALGTQLRLPQRFESRRGTIEQMLPPLKLPAVQQPGSIPVSGRADRPYPYDR